MNNASDIAHETFVVDITLDASPSVVFTAYADVGARQEWAAPAGDAITYDQADFRPGGADLFRCGPSGDLKFHGTAVYHDVVKDRRFVFFESIVVGGQTLSVALVTWELLPEGQGTRLRATTQMVSFVGTQMVDASKSGTRAAMKKLAEWLLTPSADRH